MSAFRAYRIHRNDGRISARFDQITLDDLTPGEVAVRVRYSDINYKDALAATGTAPILRKYPLVGGAGHPPHGAERPDTGHGADPRERREAARTRAMGRCDRQPRR